MIGRLVALGLAGLAYARLEARAFVLREIEVPVLPVGARPIRILHLSDLHLTPRQRRTQAWVRALVRLEPDLVVNTGDNLAHPRAVPAVLDALGALLDRQGVFVLGSNDYYAPRPKNPARYLLPDDGRRTHGPELPWRDLQAEFVRRGWLDLDNARGSLVVAGIKIDFRGVDDPHIYRDRYDDVQGAVEQTVLTIGLTHSPEPRVLDAMAADGVPLVLAGHTHGGQLCMPGFGALVTNCGLPRERAKGLSRWRGSWLHVSAGLGTSPYTPFRFACRPEATLLALVAKRGEPGLRPPLDSAVANGV